MSVPAAAHMSATVTGQELTAAEDANIEDRLLASADEHGAEDGDEEAVEEEEDGEYQKSGLQVCCCRKDYKMINWMEVHGGFGEGRMVGQELWADVRFGRKDPKARIRRDATTCVSMKMCIIVFLSTNIYISEGRHGIYIYRKRFQCTSYILYTNIVVFVDTYVDIYI